MMILLLYDDTTSMSCQELSHIRGARVGQYMKRQFVAKYSFGHE